MRARRRKRRGLSAARENGKLPSVPTRRIAGLFSLPRPMLTTYLLYFAFFFAGFLSAALLRAVRGDAAAAERLLQSAAARVVAEAPPQDGRTPTVVVSQAAVDDLRQALAVRRELDAG